MKNAFQVLKFSRPAKKSLVRAIGRKEFLCPKELSYLLYFFIILEQI